MLLCWRCCCCCLLVVACRLLGAGVVLLVGVGGTSGTPTTWSYERLSATAGEVRVGWAHSSTNLQSFGIWFRLLVAAAGQRLEERIQGASLAAHAVCAWVKSWTVLGLSWIDRPGAEEDSCSKQDQKCMMSLHPAAGFVHQLSLQRLLVRCEHASCERRRSASSSGQFRVFDSNTVIFGASLYSLCHADGDGSTSYRLPLQGQTVNVL